MSGYRYNNTYANIQQFGRQNNPPCAGSNHPLTMCLASTMDRKFLNGGAAGALTGPRSKNCQLYMSERCATEWDGFCDYFYREHGNQGQWPNNRNWPNAIPRDYEAALGLPTTMSMGDQLLRNTAERRFCRYDNCQPVCESFDPTNPDSPTITYYVGPNGSSSSCIPVCSVDPSIIDNDPVMARMLANPTAAAGTIINICNTSKRNGVNLSGTKLGQVCQNYQQNMQN